MIKLDRNNYNLQHHNMVHVIIFDINDYNSLNTVIKKYIMSESTVDYSMRHILVGVGLCRDKN